MTIVSSIATGSLALITLGSIVGTLEAKTYIATGLYAYSVIVLWRLWSLRSARPDAGYALNTRYFLAIDFVLRGVVCYFFSKPSKSGAALVSHIMGLDANVHPVLLFLCVGCIPFVISFFVSRDKQLITGFLVAMSAHFLTFATIYTLYTVNVRALESVENAWPLYITGLSSLVGTILSGVSQLTDSDTLRSVSALALTIAGFVGQIPVGGIKNYMLYDLCPALYLLSAALIKSSLKHVKDEEDEVRENNKKEEDAKVKEKIEENTTETTATTTTQTHAGTMDIEDFFTAPKTRKAPTKKITATIIKRKNN